MAAFPELSLPIRGEYKSGGMDQAKASFLADVQQLADVGKRRFRDSFGEIESVVKQALGGFKGASGSFQFDIPGLRQTAANADLALQRLTGMRDAAQRLAASTGDTSQATSKYLQALQAQVREAEQAKQIADSQVTTYGRLQAEIEKTIANNQRLADSYRATFAEQARAENAAFRSQRDINSRVSPNLAGESAINNGAGFRALDEMARVQDALAAKMSRYREEAAGLRAALDPTIVAQQRFDAEMAQASRLLDAGAISTREYAQAQALARQNLQASWAAMTASKGAADANARANDALAASHRDVRLAAIGSGQQLQDIAISLAGGQRASVVFAQQLPQLAFALSSLEGSTNKTANRIGQFATTLSGPWGLAVVGATMIVGPLIERLFGAEKQTKTTTDAFLSQADKLDILRQGLDAVTKATGDYNAQQAAARAVTLDTNRAINRQIELNLIGAKAYLASLQGSLASAEAGAGRGKRTTRDPKTGKGVVVDGGSQTTDAIRALVREAEATVSKMQTAVNSASFNVADEMARRATDRAYDIRETYKGLRDEVGRTVTDQAEKTRRITALYSQERAALDALNKTRDASDRQFGREIDSSQARSIAEAAGMRVTSDNRSYARQKQLYDSWVAQGRPADNPVAPPGASAHNKGNALDIAFGAGINPASIRKAFAEEGVRLTKILKERRHFHIEWSTTGASRIQREAAQVEQLGERAAEAIGRINAQFDDQPKLVDQAAAATKDLNKIIADLGERNIGGKFDGLIKDAREAQAAVASVVDRQIAKATSDAERQAAIQQLVLQGREREAAAAQEVHRWEESRGKLLPAQLAAVQALATAEYDRAEAIRQTQEQQAAYLDASRAARQEIEGMFMGRGADFGSIFRQLNARALTEQLFGGMFQDLDAWMKRNTGLGRATDEFTQRTSQAGSALVDLTSDIAAARNNLAGVLGGSGPAANDNLSPSLAAGQGAFDNVFGPPLGPDGEIVATAPRASGLISVRPVGSSVLAMTPEAFFSRLSSGLAGRFTSALDEAFGMHFFGKFEGVIGGALYGGAIGGKPGGILGALSGIEGLPATIDRIFGKDKLSAQFDEAFGKSGLHKAVNGAGTGSMVAGIGNALGLGLSNTGAQIGGALGSMIPIPGGQIIGAIAGGLIGKLFGSPKWATSVARNGAASTRGNKGDWEGATGGAAGNVNDAIRRLAEQFGATIGSYNVSLGLNNGNWHVSTTGRGGRLRGNQGWADVTDFKKDEEAALSFAIRDAIADGALQGLRAATQRLLQGKGDLDQQAQKAVDFESIFTRLKAIKDPVGAAMDSLDREFSRLKKIAQEAGEGMVELEELYALERAKAVKEAFERLTGSLRSLHDDLTIGDSGLSLRDRLGAAQAKYDPLAARVRAGDTSAFDEFSEAGRTVLDLTRQIFGSGTGYFDFLDELQDLTKGTLDAQQSKFDVATDRDSPFSKSAVPAADNASVVSAIDKLGGTLLDGLGNRLDALNENVGTLIQQGASHSSGTSDLRRAFGGSW